MARYKATLTYGGIKEDVVIAAYTTGDATADIEVNVDDAVFVNLHELVIALEHLTNAIRDDETGYPPI